MSLEDEFSDVVAKALAGLELDASDLARAAGVESCEIEGLLHGEMDGNVVRKIAPHLRIDAEALIGLPSYLPQPLGIAGITRIELPFRQWTVNAWLVEKDGVRLLFDAGYGSRDILGHVDTASLTAVLITHAHEDHVAGVAALEDSGVKVVSEDEALRQGELVFRGLKLRAVDLSGHKTPSAGYFIEGLEKQVLVTGDAIFAGSMGRCRSRKDFDRAFETIRAALEGADDDCVFLPGHGPATTLVEEKVSNPFAPAFL
jgi:hydroxyacylglutathione hydrolase